MDSRDAQRPGRRPAAPLAHIGERARAFAAAQRHSRLVRLLRVGFPLAAGGILTAYLLVVAFSLLLDRGRFKVGGVEITPDDLTMKDPSYFDVTKDGRYEVRAKRAVVAFNQNTPVKLIDVSGDLVQTNGVTTKLKSKYGLFDNAKAELELFDGIEIDGSNGLMARLSRAKMYPKQGLIVSEHPVSAIMPTGSVKASAMTANTKTRLMQFRGAVAVRLLPSAQTTGIGSDARQPVDVHSEELDADDAQKTAHFRGKVVAKQGDTLLQTPYLLIKYEGKAAAALASTAPAAQGGTRITFLWARNGVEITSGNDRRITSDTADFDAVADTALFVGDVVVTQEKNVLKGARLLVDRKAGKSRLEAPGEGGRIAATFYQSGTGTPVQRPKLQSAAESVQQTMLGSFKSDPTKPMEVEANALDVHDAAKKAIFTGDVKARQGDMLLRTSELTVFFSGQTGLSPASVADDAAAKAKSQDKGQVVRLEARHGVILTSKDDQTATAKWANFDVKANTALLGGGVTVTKRGENPLTSDVIKGDRLKIDLTTGVYQVESEAQAILPPRKPPDPAPAAKTPATSSSPPAAAAPTAAEKVEACPPGRQCVLIHPKTIKDKALDRLKKKAPSADVQ